MFALRLVCVYTFIIQVNVRTGDVLEYELPDGLFGQEPWFVAEPWSTGEDEGVVMMQGLDANKEKGGGRL